MTIKFNQVHRYASLVLYFVVSLLFGQPCAAVTLPFYEGFAYTNGGRLGAPGAGETVWTVGNSPGNGTPTNSSIAALDYVGFPASTSNGVQLFPPGSNKERGVDTDAFSMTGNNETLYASFLVNVQSYGTNNSPIAYWDDNGSASGSFQGVAIQSDGKLSLYRNALNTAPGGTTTAALSLNTTYLIVFRYKSISGSGNDQLALWINPPLGQASETTPDLTMSSGGSDRAVLRGFFLKQDASVTATMAFDELRLGTVWTDVTPSGVCTPASVNAGAPSNTTAFANSSASLSVSANGSLPAYQWQISTDGGTIWNNESGGSGGQTANYTTPTLTLGDNGSQYRCTISVPCDSSSATSQVAVVTVVDGGVISFRSAASGNWSDAATWEQSTNDVTWIPAVATPAAANSNITVRTGHIVTVASAVAADQVTVQSGGKISVAAGNFTIADAADAFDFDVAGTLEVAVGAGINDFGAAGIRFQSGGVFAWNRDAMPMIPAAIWADGSDCVINNILASGNSVATGISGQNFYDFTVNYPSLATGRRLLMGINADTAFRGNLSITIPELASASVAIATGGIITVGSNATFITGSASGNGNKILLSSAAGSAPTYRVGGDFSVSGYLDGFGGAANLIEFNKSGSQTLTLPTGSGLITGGTISYQVDSGSTVILNSSIGNLDVFSVNSGGALSFGANQLTGTGTLNVNSGGTIVGNGTGQLATGLTTLNFDGTLNIDQSLPTFSGGESFQVFGATTYNIVAMSIVPTPPPGASAWDYTTTPGTLIVVGGSGPTPGNPRITDIIRSGTDVIVSGTNGTVNGTYWVLNSTNVGLPLTGWSSVLTNQFDAGGNFSFTNPAAGLGQFITIQQLP